MYSMDFIFTVLYEVEVLESIEHVFCRWATYTPSAYQILKYIVELVNQIN